MQAALSVLTQESLEQETISRNGEVKTVHTVIKNNPFVIELRLAGKFDKSLINFNRYTVEASLLYDAKEERGVHYVSRRPVEYNCQVNKDGDQVKVEMQISVLSSQHEGALFKIKFQIASLGLTVFSEPLKVVSKQLQLKKNKETRGHKRPFNDVLQETLTRIEAQQKTQQTLITNLFQTLAFQLSFQQPVAPSTPASSEEPLSKKVKVEVDLTDETATQLKDPRKAFESHLAGLINAYSCLPLEDRASTVHEAVKNAPSHVTAHLDEVVDMLNVEGLRRGIGVNMDTGSPYGGVEDSPTFEFVELSSDDHQIYDSLGQEGG